MWKLKRVCFWINCCISSIIIDLSLPRMSKKCYRSFAPISRIDYNEFSGSHHVRKSWSRTRTLKSFPRRKLWESWHIFYFTILRFSRSIQPSNGYEWQPKVDLDEEWKLRQGKKLFTPFTLRNRSTTFPFEASATWFHFFIPTQPFIIQMEDEKSHEKFTEVSMGWH